MSNFPCLGHFLVIHPAESHSGSTNGSSIVRVSGL